MVIRNEERWCGARLTKRRPRPGRKILFVCDCEAAHGRAARPDRWGDSGTNYAGQGVSDARQSTGTLMGHFDYH